MSHLTSKELAAIEDQLSLEQNLISKFKTYAETTSDSELKTKYNDIVMRHQKHFDSLFNTLNC